MYKAYFLHFKPLGNTFFMLVLLKSTSFSTTFYGLYLITITLPPSHHGWIKNKNKINKLVKIKNIKVMNQTQPVFWSQPHLER